MNEGPAPATRAASAGTPDETLDDPSTCCALLHVTRFPAPAAARETVRYGGWLFTAPSPFATAIAPDCAGFFAVQVLNASWTPCPFEPIHFGAARDLSLHAHAATHRGFARWIAHPRAGTGLFVSYAALPCASETALRSIVTSLVASYRTIPADRGLLGPAADRA